MKGIVSPLPERDVAATWIPHSSQSGIRKVEVQPAPKITRSTDMKNGLQRRNGVADKMLVCHIDVIYNILLVSDLTQVISGIVNDLTP